MSKIASSNVIVHFLNKAGEILSIEGYEFLNNEVDKGQLIGKSALSVYEEYTFVTSDIKRALCGEKVNSIITINQTTFHATYIPFNIDGTGQGMLMIWSDITEQLKKRANIVESEQRFKTLFNHANDAIFMMDSKTFVDCNEATLRIFKCKRDQIIGETPYRFSPPFQPDGRSSEESALEKIMAAIDGKAQFFEWRHIQYDGSPFDAEVSLNRLDIGENVYIQAIVRDISERKQAEKEIEKNNEELRLINEELDRFVYSASHDLRAPISSLLGLVNLMKKNSDSGILELVALQEKSLQRLDHFIQDIVDYSRNKRLKLETKPIDFKLEFEEAFELLNFMDNVDKIQCELNIEGDYSFRSDPFRIKIIFNNLFSNAIKYADLTKANPFIHVNIKLNEAGAQISIKDNGEGVNQEAMDRLFEMFFRASNKGVGSGLGLYIVKESIEKLNGRIKVNSTIGEGTEFIIFLPDSEFSTLDSNAKIILIENNFNK